MAAAKAEKDHAKTGSIAASTSTESAGISTSKSAKGPGEAEGHDAERGRAGVGKTAAGQGEVISKAS
jgi:hypothetical protein